MKRTASALLLAALVVATGGFDAARPAAATSATRWIAVPVATLWVSPGSHRTVDRLTISAPASVSAWIEAMTVAQKRWLVGRVETQALYGTAVTVTATSGTWSKVVVPSQPTPRDPRGYPGWLPSWQLTSTRPAPAASVAVVTAPTARVYRSGGLTPASRLMEVSYDTRLPVVAASAARVEVALLGGGHGFLRPRDVATYPSTARRSPTGRQVVAQARKFLGLQYLWGGTSGFGYDCSGFAYSVYHVLGRVIPRDAAPQSARGTAVGRASLAPGDLVFFRDASGTVVHVAVYLGSVDGVPSVIHAPDTGRAVTITPLSAWPASSYAGARRYAHG